MYWFYRNEIKKYVSQAISEIKMVEFSDFWKNEKKLLKIAIGDKNCISAPIFANINSINRHNVPKF